MKKIVSTLFVVATSVAIFWFAVSQEEARQYDHLLKLRAVAWQAEKARLIGGNEAEKDLLNMLAKHANSPPK